MGQTWTKTMSTPHDKKRLMQDISNEPQAKQQRTESKLELLKDEVKMKFELLQLKFL
jgi:transcription initiation factor TFIID subunit TAF12